MKKKISLLFFLIVMLAVSCLAWDKGGVLNIARFAYDNLPSDVQSQINKDKYFEGVKDMQGGKHKDVFRWGFVFHPLNNFGDCPDGIQNLSDRAVTESDGAKRSYIIGGLTGYVIYISHPLHTAQSERETKSVHLLIDRASEDIVRNTTPVVNIESQPITDVKKFATAIAVESNRDYEKLLDGYKDKEQLKEIIGSAVNRAVKKSDELIILCVKGTQSIDISAVSSQPSAQPIPSPVPTTTSDIDERVNAAIKASESARSSREKSFQEEAQQSPVAAASVPSIKKQETPTQEKVVALPVSIQQPQEPKAKKQPVNNQQPAQIPIVKPISTIPTENQSHPVVPPEKNNIAKQPAPVQSVLSQPPPEPVVTGDLVEQNVQPTQYLSSEFALSPQVPEHTSQPKQTSTVESGDAFSQPLVESAHPYINWNEPHKIGKAKIVSCYDGDTITTSKGTKIRLLGLDTPEIKPLQQGAIESKEFTERFCLGKEVDVVTQKDKDKDKYGRTLAFIFVGNKCLNFELIKSGLAKVRYVGGYYTATSKLINLDKWRPDYVPPRVAVDVQTRAETPVFSGQTLPPPSFFDLDKSQHPDVRQFVPESSSAITPPSPEIEKSEVYSVAVPPPQGGAKQNQTAQGMAFQRPQPASPTQQPVQQNNNAGMVGSVIPMVPFVLYQPQGAVLNPSREYIMRFVPDGNGRYYMDVSEK
ncbi:MAG: thermonuclease family protein [Caldisericia bacterium]